VRYDLRLRVEAGHLDLGAGRFLNRRNPALGDIAQFAPTLVDRIFAAAVPVNADGRRKPGGNAKLGAALGDCFLRGVSSGFCRLGGLLSHGVLVVFVFRRHLLLELGEQLGRLLRCGRLQHPFPVTDQLRQILALGFGHRLGCHDIPVMTLPFGRGHRSFADRRSWHRPFVWVS
jgi:hypothetical protein